jgi:hypothetical protein
LCCFDMRITDQDGSCFNHVIELSSRLNISLKRWFLYGTSERYREAKVC